MTHAREDRSVIDFAGQVAVVTGAGRGLGRLYALDMARRSRGISAMPDNAAIAFPEPGRQPMTPPVPPYEHP